MRLAIVLASEVFAYYCPGVHNHAVYFGFLFTIALFLAIGADFAEIVRTKI